MQEILETKVQLLQEVQTHTDTHSRDSCNDTNGPNYQNKTQIVINWNYPLNEMTSKITDRHTDLSQVCTDVIFITQLPAFLLVCVAFRRPSWREPRLSGWARWRTLKLSAAWIWRERWWRGWRSAEAQVDRSPSGPWPTKTGDLFTLKTFMQLSLVLGGVSWSLFISVLFTALLTLILLLVSTDLVRNSLMPGTKSQSSDLHTVPDPNSGSGLDL